MRDDARAMALIARHGRTSTAFQALGDGLSHWFDETATDGGLVAYADTGRAWVAAGEPIASAACAARVAEHFVDAAGSHGRRAAFFATEGILAASPRFRRTLVGEQPVWNPQTWTDTLRGHRSMREQLRRARAKGIVVREIAPAALEREAALRAALDDVVERWLAARPMARMGFLVDARPLRHLAHRLLFVAARDGVPVALLSLAPVPARNGWLFEHLLREPGAPNGTGELLIDHAMRTLAERGGQWASLGLAPLAGPVSGWLRVTRDVSRPFFNFRGLSAFKRKLRPDAWAPIYLAYPRERLSALAMLDGLRAFAGRPLLSFALRTALRGPRPLLRALEVTLIPWTIVLALAPVSPWFPSAIVQWSWVAFDVLLIVMLGVLRRRGSARLAATIAAAVSIDALLTTAQALSHTLPMLRQRARAAGTDTSIVAELLVLLVACIAPLAAAFVLWGATRRLARLERAHATPPVRAGEHSPHPIPERSA